ncbi:unnamed protein product [Spirodela intermedia]|uniref:Uncharacterized protein n=1 Tax=Spirodela intermedia TaxID=51605 RepID=A0A7I8LI98_SPIIN|nr:unnamed protein product [Spirodela intermedia]
MPCIGFDIFSNRAPSLWKSKLT